MKKIMIMAAVVAFSVAALSCSKEDALTANSDKKTDSEKEVDPNEKISTITLSIEQPTDGSSAKTILGSKEDDSYPVNWSEGDAVAVSEKSASEYATYTLSGGQGTTTGSFSYTSGTAPSSDSAVYAYYPASSVSSVDSGTYTVTIPDTQTYVASSFGNGAMPMYASANKIGDLKTMRPFMSVLKINLTGSCTVKSILLQSASLDLSGDATLDMTTGTLSFTTGKKYVLLTCTEGVTLTSVATSFYIVVPATDASAAFTITIKDSNGYLMQKTLTTANKFTAKEIKNITSPLTVTTTKSCLLSGKFTVNSSGKQVQFTSGNLWCNSTNNTVEWHLESSQVENPSEWNASHVGRFYWSKEASVAYAQTYSYSGTSISDNFFCGESNKMTVDSQSGLYALSTTEWSYLLNTYGSSGRTDVYRFAKAKVDGVIGFIIFPDDYSGAVIGVTGIGDVNVWSYENFPDTSISEATWSAMEYSGCVFLPFDTYDVSYSTSDPDCDDSFQCWVVESYEGTPTCGHSRGERFSIRLVKTYVRPVLLPGKFTVDSDGKQVQFTSGNLWYGTKTLADETVDEGFYFEDTQYAYTSTYNSNHVCRFLWAKNSGVLSTDITSATSTATKSFSCKGDNIFFTNATQTSPRSDFCVAEESDTWRTLSSNEWTYLLSSTEYGGRGDGDSKFKKGVTVCDISNCLVIAPDGYTGAIDSSYDASAWSTAEAAGLVCLPAAGYRNGSSFNNKDSYGYYWSSSPSNSSAEKTCYTAYRLYFGGSSVDPDNYGSLSYGSSVRLVADVSAQ